MDRISMVRSLFLFATLSIPAGCSSIQGSQNSLEKVESATDDSSKYLSDQTVIDAFYASDNTARGGLDSQSYRNKIIAYRMLLINENYRDFVIELREARVGSGLLADTAVALLGLAGAVTGGATTKSALAAGTGAIGGIKGSFDKNAFYEKTLPALISQMDAARARVLTNLRAGSGKSSEEYPIAFALDDLSLLERAGSVDSAISDITQAAAQSAQDANQNLQDVTVFFSEPETDFVSSHRPAIESLANRVRRSENSAEVFRIVQDGPKFDRDSLLAQAKRVDSSGERRRSDIRVARRILVLWILGTKNLEQMNYWSGVTGKL